MGGPGIISLSIVTITIANFFLSISPDSLLLDCVFMSVHELVWADSRDKLQKPNCWE